MKTRTGECCPVCGELYTPSNWKSRHHTLPKRFFNGFGEIFVLCRNCHNELELTIPRELKLSKREYGRILKRFIEKKRR